MLMPGSLGCDSEHGVNLASWRIHVCIFVCAHHPPTTDIPTRDLGHCLSRTPLCMMAHRCSINGPQIATMASTQLQVLCEALVLTPHSAACSSVTRTRRAEDTCPSC